MYEELDEIGFCENCVGEEGVIFLCDAGWYCEACFRSLANVDESVDSNTLHDGINEGTMTPFIELVKAKYYGEVGINNDVFPDDTGELEPEEEAERALFLRTLIDLTKTWAVQGDSE